MTAANFAAAKGLIDECTAMLLHPNFKWFVGLGAGKRIVNGRHALAEAFDKLPTNAFETTPPSNDILYWAASIGRLDILHSVMKMHPLDPDLPTADGGTALEAARAQGGELKEWADAWGTYLGQYRIDKGKPVHESATCKVVFATDVKAEVGQQHVALKIMQHPDAFLREKEARTDAFSDDFVIPIVEAIDTEWNERRELCLVMPRGDRSLEGIISAERVAGVNVEKAKSLCVEVARCMQHVHGQGILHADIKPRNFVRTGSDMALKLIDFDAAVRMGEIVGFKLSTGFAPPELARMVFRNTSASTALVSGEALRSMRRASAITLTGEPSFDIWGAYFI